MLADPRAALPTLEEESVYSYLQHIAASSLPQHCFRGLPFLAQLCPSRRLSSIEIAGPDSRAIVHLLYQAILDLLLPCEWEGMSLSGQGGKVVLIDLTGCLSYEDIALHFLDQLIRIHPNGTKQPLLESCFSRLQLIQPSHSMAFYAILMQLEKEWEVEGKEPDLLCIHGIHMFNRIDRQDRMMGEAKTSLWIASLRRISSMLCIPLLVTRGMTSTAEGFRGRDFSPPDWDSLLSVRFHCLPLSLSHCTLFDALSPARKVTLHLHPASQ